MVFLYKIYICSFTKYKFPVKKKILISIAFFIFFQKNLMADHFIILQSTTSTRDSGLYEFLLPKFKEEFGALMMIGHLRDKIFPILNKLRKGE